MYRRDGRESSANTRDDDDDYIPKRSSSHFTSGYRDTDLNDYGGKKRRMDTECHDSDSSTSTVDLVVTGVKAPWPSEEVESSSGNLFGLNVEFVRSLGITPPLDKWVHVTNFRCDKSELKEVLELAGRVVMCSVIAIRERYAKVMYSHPLEAVQAVSMLNGQTYYGQLLSITMVPCPTDTVILPKGLANVGPGLGIKGKPISDIVHQYENFTKQKDSLVDTTIFSRDDEDHHKDIKKKKLSKYPDSDDDHKEKTKQNPRGRRIISFKIKTLEELHANDSPGKTLRADYKGNYSPSSDIDRQSKNEEWSRNPNKENSSSKDLQVRPSFQIPTISSNKPSPTGSTHSPGFGSQPRPFPQNLSAGPQFDPRTNVNPIRPPGFNMGGPNMPMRTMGPPGGNMNMGPGMMMGPSGPGFNPGPPGMAGPGPSGPGMCGPSGPPGMCGPGPMMGPPGPGPGPVMNMNGPGGFGPPGMNPNLIPPGVGPSPASVPPGQMPASDSVGLEFNNLPPSTTFPLLCEKVSLCGQVLSLQLTTPGCAVARFSKRSHAERCFQVFNGLCIDGCVIQTRHIE